MRHATNAVASGVGGVANGAGVPLLGCLAECSESKFDSWAGSARCVRSPSVGADLEVFWRLISGLDGPIFGGYGDDL